MARSHAKITVGVWMDDDWHALSRGAQWLYWSLLAHPQVSLVGLLDRSERRWARMSTGTTVDEIQADLAELRAAGYVVVDDDTDEVIIRSFTRHDISLNRWNRNLTAGFWRAWQSIMSAALRAVVIREMSDDLWTKVEPAAPPEAAQIRRSLRLEPDPDQRSGPDPDVQSQPETEPRFEPQPTPRFEPPSPSPSPSPVTVSQSPSPSSSSSQSDSPPEPTADDDEDRGKPPDRALTPDDRRTQADAACTLLGTADHTRRLNTGRVHNPDRHLAACIAAATRDHHATALQLAATRPDWTPAQIAEHLTRPPIERTTIPADQSTHPLLVQDRLRLDTPDPPTPPAANVPERAAQARAALQAARRTTPTGETPDA